MIKKIKKFFNFFLFINISILFLLSSVNAFSFDENKVKIISSEEKKLHETPDFIVHGDFIHVVWTTWPTEYESYIYYKNSNDSGKTWNDEKLISFNSTKAINPTITTNDNTLHIAWIDYRDNVSEIYYSRSFNDGNSFIAPERLTFNTSRKTYIYDVSINANVQKVFLTWKDYRFGSSEIFFKKSNDNGYTWTDDLRLTADYTPSYLPILGSNQEEIIIFYEDWVTTSVITILKSIDNGDNWNGKMWITKSIEQGDSIYPDIHISEGNVFLVFQNDGTRTYQIYFSKSSDFGENWGEIKQLTYSKHGAGRPIISDNSDRLILLWSEYINNSNNVFYKTSFDEGNSWSEAKKLELNHNVHDLSMMDANENTYLVWQNYHEPGWADICFYSFFNDISPENGQNESKNKETPGFEFILFFILMFLTTIFIKTKIYKGNL